MKRIKINSLFLVLLSVVFCTACDMDKMPQGSLGGDIDFTLQDCRNYRIGLYTSFRELTTGAFVIYSDIQMDDFHGVSEYTGALNMLYTGNITPGTELIETIWAGDYAGISQANYFFQKMEVMQATTKLTATEISEVKRYNAEALFMRAFCYFDLAQRFCAAYSPETAAMEYTGMPLVTKYDPTSDNTQYPGRSTLEATYQLIWDDLEQALEDMAGYEEKNPEEMPYAMSPWITSDVIKALQARVALTMGDYETALKKSESLINSSGYALTNNATDLYSFWRDDWGTGEAFWLVTMTRDYTGSSNGSMFLTNTGDQISFIPTQDVASLFEKEDIRMKSYLADRPIKVTLGTETVAAFSKYPGNPYLYYNINTFTNMAKPFRLAEQYLIAAESAAELAQVSKANLYLNNLRKSRIAGYTTKQYAGARLAEEIQTERRRELLGEGFRMNDLKRKHKGFQRSKGQKTGLVINKIGNVHLLKYEADDYRFVWPIPQGEIDTNPQIKSQQNPGY